MARKPNSEDPDRVGRGALADSSPTRGEEGQDVTAVSCKEGGQTYRHGKGEIYLCSGCGCFELEYGNFRVTLDAPGLELLSSLVREGCDDVGTRYGPDERLYLKLNDCGIRLVVPAVEIEDLWLLLKDGIRYLRPLSPASETRRAAWIH